MLTRALAAYVHRAGDRRAVAQDRRAPHRDGRRLRREPRACPLHRREHLQLLQCAPLGRRIALGRAHSADAALEHAPVRAAPGRDARARLVEDHRIRVAAHGGQGSQSHSSVERRSRFVSPRRFFSSSRRSFDAFVGFVARRGRRTFIASRSCSTIRVGRELAVAELRALVLRDRTHDRAELARARAAARRRSAPPSPRRRRAPRPASSSSARAGRRARSSARNGTRSPTE